MTEKLSFTTFTTSHIHNPKNAKIGTETLVYFKLIFLNKLTVIEQKHFIVYN